jgi:hypothetical protein
VTLGGVIHPQVVADLPDHDLSGVEPHADGEVEAPAASQLVGIASQLVPQVQGRVARPLRVILVRDRRAKERHDSVSRVLVHGPLEAVHAVSEDLEEAVEDRVPLLGIDLLSQLHRALHVGKEDGDLLALALERGLRLEDLVGEVLGGVRAGVSLGSRLQCLLLSRPTFMAEPR